MATTYLTRTPSSGAATQKATFSFWVKKTNITGTPNLFRMYTNSTQYVRIRFESSNKISFIIINSDSYVVQLISTQVFRDTSAWYNIVCNMDTTQATASDRAKIYINGERITAYDTAVYPPTQDANIIVTPSGTANVIGTQIGDSASYFEGCMSHINFTDGYVYQASEFGETDSTTGEWKIKTSPSVTYGTNGFFILKDGNSVTDQSGEGNNFAVTAGTLTNTEDCPSNNFTTFAKNYLARNPSNPTFANGGTTVGASNDGGTFAGAIAPTTGKYYWEVKIVNGNNARRIGIVRSDATNTNSTTGFQVGGAAGSTTIWTAAYDGYNGYIVHMDGVTRTQLGAYATYTTNDIIGVALDCDNYTITWYKNDVLIYALSLNATYFEGGVFPANRCDTNQTISYNFGNGYFGTTAVASAGTNASGIGIFEYDVPTGYTALSTKGLNL